MQELEKSPPIRCEGKTVILTRIHGVRFKIQTLAERSAEVWNIVADFKERNFHNVAKSRLP